VKAYILNVLIAWDMAWNAVFCGMPDETISARAAKAEQQGKRWACLLCAFLDCLQANHCRDSIRGDIARANAVEHELGD
jgi:hypothetical protein